MDAMHKFILEDYLRNIRSAWPDLPDETYRKLVRLQADKLNSPRVTTQQLEDFFAEQDI